MGPPAAAKGVADPGYPAAWSKGGLRAVPPAEAQGTEHPHGSVRGRSP